MKWFLSIYGVLSCAVSWAQAPVTYTIKPGIELRTVIPASEIYRYPSFTMGTVVFKDGLTSTGKLNYNALISEMQFIDAKGDTLALANEQTFRYVLVANDTFYFSQGYIRIIKGNEKVKFGEKVAFREYVQKPGAYGLSTATTATNNLTAILDKRSVALDASQELVVVKNVTWLIGDRFNLFVPADKKNIFKMFPRQKQAIEEYLKNNEVNFSKEDDLIRLTGFLGGL